MINTQSNPKAQGVHVPQGRDVDHPPRTILNVVPMQMFGVEYTDDSGQKHITTVVRAGNMIYFAPNGELWTSQLTPLKAEWFAKQFLAKAGSPDAPDVIPVKDTVEVMPERTPVEAPKENVG